MTRALLALLLAACTSSEKDPSDLDTDTTADDTDAVAVDDTDDGPATMDFETFCARASQAYVDHLARCFPDVYDPEGPFVAVNEDNCLAAREALDEGRRAYDPAAAAACVRAAEAETGCTWDLQGFRAAACDDAFTPLVPVGGDCGGGDGAWLIIGGTCAEGWCNDRSTCPGSCEAFVGVGEDCTSAQCEWRTTTCDPTSQRCVALPVAGEACPDGACAIGARCDAGTCRTIADPDEGCDADHLCALSAMECVDEVCTLLLPEGMTCDFDFQCAAPLACRDGDGDDDRECLPRGVAGDRCTYDDACASDLYCDWQTDECVPRLAIGEDCRDVNVCVEGAWCMSRPEQPGLCVETGGRGDACVDAAGPSTDPLACEVGLQCMQDGSCQPPGGAGDPCRVDLPSCTGDLVCDRATWTCAPPAAQGEGCNPFDADTCVDGLSCTCTGTSEECRFWIDVYDQAWHSCQPTAVEGEACWADRECEGGYCDICGSGDCDYNNPGVCGPAYEACVP
jgi:hypothetical protein